MGDVICAISTVGLFNGGMGARSSLALPLDFSSLGLKQSSLGERSNLCTQLLSQKLTKLNDVLDSFTWCSFAFAIALLGPKCALVTMPAATLRAFAFSSRHRDCTAFCEV